MDLSDRIKLLELEIKQKQSQLLSLQCVLSHERYKDELVMRNLIFFPDGHVRYDWEHTGAILL